VGAWLIDWLIVTVVGVLLVLPFHGIRRIHQVVGNVNTTTLHFQPGAVLVNIALVLAYGTVLCGSARGQTLGMAAVGARAVRAADGGAIGYGWALGRAAFEYLMAILLFFPWVIDMLFPLWDSRNQTLHDKVMDTVVVKV
jgi:uncharacterized RDD family membrane protein YckC